MLFVASVRNERPQEFAKFALEESEVLADLRAQGVLLQVWRRLDGIGLFGLLEADSEDELRRHLERLPLTRHRLVSWDLVEVSTL